MGTGERGLLPFSGVQGEAQQSRWLTLPWAKQRVSSVNVHQLVLADLAKVARTVKSELRSYVLQKVDNRKIGRRLLFLFQCDLLPGISGKILESKGNRDFSSVRQVSLWSKVAGW